MNKEISSQEKFENRLLYCTLFTFAMSGISSQPLGSFIPFLRESYNLSYEVSGILLSCQSIGNLIAVLIAGILPIYLGRRRSILFTSIWMAAAYLVFASGLGNPILLMVACAMTGLARGGNSNFSNTMISTLPSEKAVKGFNLLHGSFALGALASPIMLVLCVRRWPVFGWRITAGIILILCIIQVFVYAKMPLPKESFTKSVKTTDRSFFKVKEFWLASAMLLFYISTEYAIVGWMVTYFQDIGILQKNQAQLTGSLLWFVIFLGRMIGAFTSDKLSGTKLLLVDGLGQCVFFLVMFFSRTPGMVIFGLMGVGLFLSTIYPTAFSFGSMCIKGNDFGCSIMIFFGSAGGIITPALVGLVAEKAGIRAGMAVVAVLTVLLLCSIALSAYSAKRKHMEA